MKRATYHYCSLHDLVPVAGCYDLKHCDEGAEEVVEANATVRVHIYVRIISWRKWFVRVLIIRCF